MVHAITGELELRKDYLSDRKLETIYFGGGTPSLLNAGQLEKIFDAISKYFVIDKDAEITLEANPDDLTVEKLKELRQSPVNRLSIGVQSFFDEDLQLMNRAHNSVMAEQCILDAASAGFSNLTIDLIYGIPGMSHERWKKNLEKAFSLPVNHLSCYNLTVETKTALHKMVSEGRISEVSDTHSAEQFMMLMEMAEREGFEHYEISNFAKSGFYSRHNSAYWKNKPYLGAGPSAHSYNGITRQWNVSSNALYMKSVEKGEIPATIETLSESNRYNEYLMTGLRTMWGVDADLIARQFGKTYHSDYLIQIADFLESGDVIRTGSVYQLSKKGKLIADRIAAKMFVV